MRPTRFLRNMCIFVKKMGKHKMRLKRIAIIGVTILGVTAMVFYLTIGELPASMLIRNVNTWQVKDTGLTEVKLKRGGSPLQHYDASAAPPTSLIEGDPMPIPGKPKLLLIVAYLRSGSTFTASLFSQQPDSFYVFEPLHMVVKTVKKHMALRYVNGTVRPFPTGIPDNPQSLFRECMDPWLRCAFRQVDTASLFDKFHLQFSKSIKPFLLCVKHIRSLTPLTRYAINHCIRKTEMKCNSANLRVIKTIRLSMEMAHSLMAENENMKIVHLVRDPRAMFLSQSNYKLIKDNNKTSQFERLCSRMRDDIYFTRQLLEVGNKNVKLVRYEDIAFNPIEMTKELYTFIGEPLTKGLLRYVAQSTSLNLKDGCAFCTRRGNSTLTASKWRSTIHPSLLKLVDEHCKDLLQPLGYHFTEDINYLRDTSLPIFQEHIPLLEHINLSDSAKGVITETLQHV
ncbi:carbohydrate sulfotransferase 5-like [Mya arenaria]|uniref:carbohydrate sulfotransferase 5-like n=1 Tax=Mya arenaria TaxID=6604 RepID=UPI0022DF7A20|nr:carbohydrate sulfotransferase 5-like [Mya arenaria]XP_052798279.1 carbohydrate sulfotransferase 5-like [Mya arenaria]XP_052798281.1 carbohydrate sulfotransferase 5-like [Mya arenaria]